MHIKHTLKSSDTIYIREFMHNAHRVHTQYAIESSYTIESFLVRTFLEVSCVDVDNDGRSNRTNSLYQANRIHSYCSIRMKVFESVHLHLCLQIQQLVVWVLLVFLTSLDHQGDQDVATTGPNDSVGTCHHLEMIPDQISQ